jgi:hypothetical protein
MLSFTVEISDSFSIPAFKANRTRQCRSKLEPQLSLNDEGAANRLNKVWNKRTLGQTIAFSVRIAGVTNGRQAAG